MARKVTYTEGYEITGKLDKSQKGQLQYANKNNKAWYSPDGTNNARNFRRFIALSKNRYGRVTFQVHTKSSAAVSPAIRASQAVFGGCTRIIPALQDDGQVYLTLANMFQKVKTQYGKFGTFLSAFIMPALRSKNPLITWIVDGETLSVQNPWFTGYSTHMVQLDAAILQKFSQYLCTDILYINGAIVCGFPRTNSTTFNSWRVFIDSGFNDGSFAVNSLSGNVEYKGKGLLVGTSSKSAVRPTDYFNPSNTYSTAP